MKTRQQIEARLVEAREQLSEWQINRDKARKERRDDGYYEYCQNIVTHFSSEVKLLEWILHPVTGPYLRD